MAAFQTFGPDHLAVLAATAGTAGWLVASTARVRRTSDARIVQWAAALLLGNEVVSWGVGLATGRFGLPLQLCDLAVLLMAWALLGGGRTVRELACLWGLAGSSQAILTPDLDAPFPSYPWIQFFLGHGWVVLGAVYLLVGGRLRLTAGSVGRVWLMSNGYLAAVGLVNWRLGTNFGYLAHKPAHPSLLDYLGPWPVYLLAMELIALVLFCLCLALSRVVERRAERGLREAPRYG